MAAPAAGSDDLVGLLRQVRRGDDDAFGSLFRCYRPRVERTALVALGDAEDAADAVVEVFVRVRNALPRLRRPAAFEAWLHRITANVCRTLARRRAAYRARCSPDDPREVATEDGDGALVAAVREALVHLPRIYWEVLALQYLHGLSAAETAQALRVPVGTAKARAARGRKLLARHLAARGYSFDDGTT